MTGRTAEPPEQSGAPMSNDARAEKPQVNLRESPLGWLTQRRDKNGKPLLSDIEIAAGEKLRADFWFAQMTPNVTANWSMLCFEGSGRRGSPDHGAELSDHVIAAQERVRLALKAVGPKLAFMLIDVCCFLKGLEAAEKSSALPQRSGKIVLQIALDLLARHYGLISDAPVLRGVGRISHWGIDGYRPGGTR
jgi:Domain of unknown function (DUF6456)